MTRDEVLAMEPGRELDALVAERVFSRDPMNARRGLKNPLSGEYEPQYYWGYPEGHDFAPFYSTDIAAAWEVVEKVTEIPTTLEDARHAANTRFMVLFQKENVWAMNAQEAAEFICKAALLAVMEADDDV